MPGTHFSLANAYKILFKYIVVSKHTRLMQNKQKTKKRKKGKKKKKYWVYIAHIWSGLSGRDMDSDESVSRGVVSDNFGFMAWGHCQLQEVFADIMYRVEYTRNSQDQLSVLLWTTLPVSMKHIYDLVELWNEGRDVKSRLTLIWVDGDENLLVFNRRRRCAEHPFFKYMEQERLKKVLPWVMGGTGSNWDQVTVQRMDSEADDEADDLYCAPYSYREVELHREAQALRAENARLERTMEDERLVCFCLFFISAKDRKEALTIKP